jgi:hypothetical protein
MMVKALRICTWVFGSMAFPAVHKSTNMVVSLPAGKAAGTCVNFGAAPNENDIPGFFDCASKQSPMQFGPSAEVYFAEGHPKLVWIYYR